jgi:serine/threonine protein kinase
MGAPGAQYGSDKCYLRYEVYEFFTTSVLSPPPAESPPSSSEGKRPRVLGISLSVVAFTIVLIAAIGFWKWNFFSRAKRREEIYRTGGVEGDSVLMPTIANPELIFKFDILRESTSNFKAENKLGEGGFGSVFKGVLPDGREVAVKRLFMGTRQADAEFLNEANLISRVQHRNLVKLLGCSVEGSERLLVYEYLQNSSLDKILFDPTKRHLLDWKKRSEIILGTARGLAYLHEESDVRVIHRDIKASNILLDDKHRPKIADFGLARFFAEDQSHVSTRVAGTLGYMAPEYALRGQLTEKADVFSFGVLVLEIISGRKNQSSTEDMEFLIEGTWRLYKANRGLEIMDPTLKDSYSWEDGIRAIKIGLLCTQAAAALRPSMFRVVSMLTSEREHLPSPTRPAFIDLDAAGAAQQLKRGRIIDPERTSSSAATSSTTPSEIHSAAADPNASSILEPR